MIISEKLKGIGYITVWFILSLIVAMAWKSQGFSDDISALVGFIFFLTGIILVYIKIRTDDK